MTFSEVVAHLDGRQIGTEVRAICPAHPDKDPSLAIAEGDDGRTLLNCRAGCETATVVKAAGLQMADLFPVKGGCLASIRFAAWRQLLLPVVVEGDRLDLMCDSRRVARLT